MIPDRRSQAGCTFGADAERDPQVLLDAGTHWPPGVRAVMTTRHGGHSSPPFEQWNLGDHVGDRPQDVAANRLLLAQRLGVRPVFLRQVHGIGVVELVAGIEDGLQADACWSAEPGLACTAMVADCLPVLLCAGDGSSVAAAHAGWRGLLGQDGHSVLEALCDAWPAARTGRQRAALRAWLGPCIGPRAFEVGAEVMQAYTAHDPAARAGFQPVAAAPGAKFLADLPWLARQRLRRLGIEAIEGNDGGPGWCTVSAGSSFFSHRRDAARLGSTGRMAACIWRC